MKPPVNMIQMELNRRNFLRAGKKILQTKKIANLKVRDIVNEAGMAQGSFYNYFESKEKFLADLMTDIAVPFRIAVRPARLKAKDAHSFVRNMIQTSVDVARADENICALMANNPHGVRHLFYSSELYEPTRLELIEDLQAGIDKGYFCPHNMYYLADMITLFRLDTIIKAVQEPDNEEEIQKDVEFACEVLGAYFKN